MAAEDDPRKYEHLLRLPNNRQLHYASAGNESSNIVVLFFSGTLSIGSASNSTLPTPVARLGAHYIAPTLPGNGDSSSTPNGVSYHTNLCRTVTALLEELHPSEGSKGNAIERLLIGGGSYGSVPAQMLYGAPFGAFPYGRRISSLLLMAPFSPLKYHKDYARHMTWTNWLSIGPPSQWIPFRLIPRLLSTVIAARCKDMKGARGLLNTALFSKMDAEEKEAFEIFAQMKRGKTAEQLMNSMADGVLRCTANWDGFIEGPDVLHSDWGFEPAKLDGEHSNEQRPVLIVQGEADELGPGMAEWLVENYAHGMVKKIGGGHLASLYHMDEIWDDILES